MLLTGVGGRGRRPSVMKGVGAVSEVVDRGGRPSVMKWGVGLLSLQGFPLVMNFRLYTVVKHNNQNSEQNFVFTYTVKPLY